MEMNEIRAKLLKYIDNGDQYGIEEEYKDYLSDRESKDLLNDWSTYFDMLDEWYQDLNESDKIAVNRAVGIE